MKLAHFLAYTFAGLIIHGSATDQTSMNNGEQMQGNILTGYSAAFNAPAAITVRNKGLPCQPSSINVFLDASFTYWFAGEDGLKLASTGVLNSGTSYFAQNTNSLFQSFNYKPGFKVGLGIVGCSNWVLDAE